MALGEKFGNNKVEYRSVVSQHRFKILGIFRRSSGLKVTRVFNFVEINQSELR